MHTYTFTFENSIYSVSGTAPHPPNLIVLPDMRVVRVTEILETYPAQIGAVELVPAAKAVKHR